MTFSELFALTQSRTCQLRETQREIQTFVVVRQINHLFAGSRISIRKK
jgi:hypothetical protein